MSNSRIPQWLDDWLSQFPFWPPAPRERTVDWTLEVRDAETDELLTTKTGTLTLEGKAEGEGPPITPDPEANPKPESDPDPDPDSTSSNTRD